MLGLSLFANHPHQTFLTNHFIVSETNVASFEEAEVVLFATPDAHPLYQQLFEKLVTKTNVDYSQVLMEGMEDEEIPQQGLPAHVKREGWDSKSQFKKESRQWQAWETGITLLETTNSTSDSSEHLMSTIQQIAKLILSKTHMEDLWELQKHKGIFNKNRKKEIEALNTLYTDLLSAPNQIEKRTEEAIRQLYKICVKNSLTYILNYHYYVQRALSMVVRQKSLMQKIRNAWLAGRLTFVQAAERHLIKSPLKMDFYQKTTLPLLSEGLKHKKYIIIKPHPSSEISANEELCCCLPIAKAVIDAHKVEVIGNTLSSSITFFSSLKDWLWNFIAQEKEYQPQDILSLLNRVQILAQNSF